MGEAPRLRRRTLLGIAAGSLLAACTGVQPTATAPATGQGTPAIKRGGVLKAHVQDDWSTFDPHLAQASSHDFPLVFDYLTRTERNPATNEWAVKPSLAESWELPDPTTVVFKLRRGVKFHDGTDFTAQVAKWNLERMMNHPKSAAKDQTTGINSVEAVDPLTLRLRLSTPNAALFSNLTSDADSVTAMISQANAEKIGDSGLAQHPVGTGPFKLVEWKPGDHVTYKRWDSYWKQGADTKPLPYLDGVDVAFQPDSSVAVVQLRSGNYDLMTDIDGRDVATLRSSPGVVFREAPWQSNIYCLCFNARPGTRLAGDKMKKVRQAVFTALDRDTIAATIGRGIGQPTYFHLVPGQIGYNGSLPKYSYDLGKAKQLLADAGFPSGLELTLDFISRPEDVQNAQLYQQMLAAVGIKLTLRPAERVAWVNTMKEGKFDMSAFRTITRPDPDQAFAFRLSKGGPGNYAGWDNADVTKAIADGRSTYDTTKRQEAYERLQKTIYDEAYYDFVWFRKGAYAMSNSVKGWEDPWLGYFTNSTPLWLDR